MLAEPSPAPAGALAPRSGFVATDTGRLFYEEAGEGPVVVLIHDGLVHRETWDAQFATFARRFHVLRYDRRGYGKSDVPTEPFSNVEDLASVLAARGLRKAVLVGCSFGGSVAIDFTLEHPEVVEKLVLVGAVVRGLAPSAHCNDRGGHLPPDLAKDVTRAIAYWSTEDPYLLSPRSIEARQRVKALLTANPQNLRVPFQLLRGSSRVPPLGRLGEVRVPTLVIVGADDIPDVHAHAGAIQAGIAGARRVVVPDAGHLVHMERPEEFNRLVLDFLGSSAP
ncbi:MAG TPA: alpha/beta hydrolase [Vicinamibacteria bacterium]|nr:alpha/beta hydrolase [Vicinamibacteria bacterium]